MPIHETYSKRLKRLTSQGEPVLYQYDDLPLEFRTQVVHIWRTALGDPAACKFYTQWMELWAQIHNTIAREKGLLVLVDRRFPNEYERCEYYMIRRAATTTFDALDIIELSFRVIDLDVRRLRHAGLLSFDVAQEADDALTELNARFREHAIGYQYLDGAITRVDSQFLHTEVVEPALHLLHVRGFEGAEEEFLEAHAHFRKGETKEAIVAALRAFESTMRTICDRREWPYSPGATAKDLINAVLSHGLVSSYLQTSLGSLRTLLESALPAVRNKTSGHGQGATRVDVPDHLVAFALHTMAANIVLLIEADKALM